MSYDKKFLKAEYTLEVNWATIPQFSLHCLTPIILTDLTRQGLPDKIWVRFVLAIFILYTGCPGYYEVDSNPLRGRVKARTRVRAFMFEPQNNDKNVVDILC